MSAAIVVALLCGSVQTTHAQSTANPVQAENARAGTAAWNVRASGDSDVYASQVDVAPGDEVDLHVSSRYRYRIDVYRLGWYGGAGGRLVACLPSCTGDEQGRALQGQDAPSTQPLRANWPVTDVLHTGGDWVSGYYLVEALQTTGPGAGGVSTTWLVVRESPDASPSQILVQVPANTWEAYNDWGGRGLYDFVSQRASRVSFLRPFGGNAQTPLWNELQTVRFLEREGYDVSYQTDIATDADPAGLLDHRLVIVNGHDEYWTQVERDAFDAARNQGTNLAFLGANDAYWRIDYEDGRTTIHSDKQERDYFRPTDTECELMGVQHTNFTAYAHPLDYTVTAAGAADPWLAGTGLDAGSTIAAVVGREHDAQIPGCGPQNAVVLFHYAGSEPVQNADAVKLTVPGGARVFSSGAYDFSLALDGYRSDDTLGPAYPVVVDRNVPVDARVQQFMRNALDDLTRPEAPLVVNKVSDAGRLRVRTGWPLDPRVVGRIVTRVRAEDGARQIVCTGHDPCYPPRATSPGTYHFEVSYVDRWGAVSAPTSSTPWTWHDAAAGSPARRHP